jgi:hypothetical protein
LKGIVRHQQAGGQAAAAQAPPAQPHPEAQWIASPSFNCFEMFIINL